MSRFLRWERDKDPDEYLDYSIDWTNDLQGGEAITSSSWVSGGSPNITPLVISLPSINGSVTTAWFNGGTDRTMYAVTNHITTQGGRILEKTVNLRVSTR